MQMEPSKFASAIDRLAESSEEAAQLAVEAGEELAKIAHSVWQQQAATYSTDSTESIESTNENDKVKVKCYGSVLKYSRFVREAFQRALPALDARMEDAGDAGDVLNEVLEYLK